MATNKETYFEFRGDCFPCKKCKEGVEHPPEKFGEYGTVCNGTGQNFCRGIPGKNLEIEYYFERGGDGYSFDILTGVFRVIRS